MQPFTITMVGLVKHSLSNKLGLGTSLLIRSEGQLTRQAGEAFWNNFELTNLHGQRCEEISPYTNQEKKSHFINISSSWSNETHASSSTRDRWTHQDHKLVDSSNVDR